MKYQLMHIRILLTCILFIFSVSLAHSQITFDYYLPENENYDPEIPTPESIIGHEVGEWHITHDKLVNYMRAVAEASDRVTIDEHASTYENRPVLLLTITSPDNHQNINQIQSNHKALTDPSQSGTLDVSEMPAVVYMGYSVHGNEPSGSNASMVVVYHLAAAQSDEVRNMLENSVILLDPSFNPDGLNRFATWVNMHKSHTTVSDPNTREYNEVWPGGRTNHYWFDLNRDWLPVQHPSSRGRIHKFHDWHPNVLTDFHEMGTNATYFFQPGVPERTHPLTPQINQDLTMALAEYHADALDDRQQLYYTRERFDDYYFGKGSTYPDIQGSVGILFEQASSRGHAQESIHGVKTFHETILNQVTTSFSTIKGSLELREELHEYKRSFYNQSLQEARSGSIKAYVFGDENDIGKTWHLADIIHPHGIDIYELGQDIDVEGTQFHAGRAYIIPAEQPQAKLIEAMFERRTVFEDSLFYDVSTWTLPYAFNLPFAELGSRQFNQSLLGSKIEEPDFPSGELKGEHGDYAYIFNWSEYYAPRALYRLQKEGVRTLVASAPFSTITSEGLTDFGYGAILVSLGIQEVDQEKIQGIIDEIVEYDAVTVYSVNTGLTQRGIDLGSPSFNILDKPEVAVIGGRGTTVSEIGEVWHLFDQRIHVPLTILEKHRMGSADLDRYNVIVMGTGNYSDLPDETVEKLKGWVHNGGTLIAMRGAISWIRSQGLADLETVSREAPDLQPQRYADLDDLRGAQVIGGSIFNAKLDITHPIGYGFTDDNITVFRNTNTFIERPDNPFSTPVYYDTDNPLASGYISDQNLERIGGTASVVVNSHGNGRVITMIDNPNFRAFWFGTNKLFLNAVFFGNTISGASTN
jgi:hypothetical protein